MSGYQLLQVQWSVVAIGTAGILSNAYSLYYNFRRKGFPRQLYIVLNVIDLSVCVIGVLLMIQQIMHYDWSYYILFFLYMHANQTSGLWTCIVGRTRLLAMSRPFYQINKTEFWTTSTILLAMGTIPQGILCFFLLLFYVNVYVYFGCAIGLILVNLVLTVWTAVLLNRKSIASSERDKKRRNAAVTVVLIGILFLLTNISCSLVWGSMLGIDIDVLQGAQVIFYILIVVNAALNPMVILRRQLMSLCCSGRRRESTHNIGLNTLIKVSAEAKNVASGEPQ